MNELWIRFDKKTHKPIYMAIGKPNCKNCELKDGICRQRPNKCEKGYPLETLYGDKNVVFTPIPNEEE
jgi:hypothetical protein